MSRNLHLVEHAANLHDIVVAGSILIWGELFAADLPGLLHGIGVIVNHHLPLDQTGQGMVKSSLEKGVILLELKLLDGEIESLRDVGVVEGEIHFIYFNASKFDTLIGT